MQIRALLTRFRERAAAAADRTARGSALPAGVDSDPPPAPQKPSARSRGAMRRRVRHLRRRREGLLLELGALVFELRRRDEQTSEALDARLAELTALDAEHRALASALDDRRPLVELVQAGIAGPCEACGALIGTTDRYCASCGVEIARRRQKGSGPAEPSPADASSGPAEPSPAAKPSKPAPAAAGEPPEEPTEIVEPAPPEASANGGESADRAQAER